MKKNRVFKSLFFFGVTCIVGGLSVLHSCKEDVEPFYTTDIAYLVKVTAVDSETKETLSGVTASVTYPDKMQKTIELSDGILRIDMDNREDGQLILQFEKDDFVSKIDTIMVDRSKVDDDATCEYLTTVMLTEMNEPFTVTAGVGMEISVSGSDVSVKFPENCLVSNANISVTEISSADEIAEEGSELELIGGRVALKSFHFLPEGQTFEEPIEVTFSIPEITGELVFATFVDEDGIGEWESVSVLKNGDGTGTAEISHFSNWFLCTSDRWRISDFNLSDPIDFTGDCDEDLVATIEKSFDSDDTEAKDDLPFSIQFHFSSTKIVDAHLGYEKTISGKYTILSLENLSKGYTIEIPSFPVVWEPAGEETCHTGGSGN